MPNRKVQKESSKGGPQTLRISNSEYDRLLDKFEEIRESGDLPPRLLSVEECDELEKYAEKDWRYIVLACYYYEMTPPSSSPKEHYGKLNLQNFISEHLVFTEEDEPKGKDSPKGI